MTQSVLVERQVVPLSHLTPTAFVSVNAAATTFTLWTVSTGRTAKIVKLIASNRNAASASLRIGIGVAPAFTQIFPDLIFIPGFDGEYTEDQLPSYWFGEFAAGNIVVQSSVGAVAPNDVQVFAEIVEKGA